MNEAKIRRVLLKPEFRLGIVRIIVRRVLCESLKLLNLIEYQNSVLAYHPFRHLPPKSKKALVEAVEKMVRETISGDDYLIKQMSEVTVKMVEAVSEEVSSRIGRAYTEDKG